MAFIGVTYKEYIDNISSRKKKGVTAFNVLNDIWHEYISGKDCRDYTEAIDQGDAEDVVLSWKEEIERLKNEN